MITLAELAKGLERSLAEVRPGMERLMGVLMAENAETSKAMVGREGNPGWDPLAESTIAEKQRLGFVNRISATDPLLRTGDLRDSIEPVVHAEMPGVVIGEVGSDLPYAVDQEMGTARIPPRPFLSPPFITIGPRAVEVFGELAVNLLVPGRLR